MCLDEGFEIAYDMFLHYHISNSTTLSNFLENYEYATFQLLKKLLDKTQVEYIVGRNFTHSFDNNINILDGKLVTDSWVDIISKRGELSAYPKNVRVLSSIGMDPIIDYLKSYGYSKSEYIDLFESSIMGISWLKNSKYNAKVGMHPLEEAHLLWAEYLFEQIDKLQSKNI